MIVGESMITLIFAAWAISTIFVTFSVYFSSTFGSCGLSRRCQTSLMPIEIVTHCGFRCDHVFA